MSNKGSKDSLSSVINTYLLKTNRPFSANDVFNNLNTKDNKLGKTAVNKALDQLVANQKIILKENGKQKVFFVDQNNFETIDDNQMKDLDQQLDQLTQEFNGVKHEVKQKESKLSSFKSCLSFEEISQQLSEVTEEVMDLENRCQSIDKTVKDFDPKENQKLKNERQKLLIEWKRRKRLASDMLDMIVEHSSKPKKALMEEMDIETDEDLNIKVPKD